MLLLLLVMIRLYPLLKVDPNKATNMNGQTFSHVNKLPGW